MTTLSGLKFKPYWFMFNGACYHMREVECCDNCKHHEYEWYNKSYECICSKFDIVTKPIITCDKYEHE